MMQRNRAGSMSIKAKYQRAGFLHKLPMSKVNSDRWQKRLFMAKDGFLLYYAPNTPINQTHFNTKPKGVIPLGGCHVEACERGPKDGKFGIRITHPDFYAGRVLILAAATEDEQRGWLETLNECGRVTMENALLGDSLIERLRAEGTTAQQEREEALQKLQEEAMALKQERDEKLRLEANQEEAEKMRAEAEAMMAEREAERKRFEDQLAQQREAAEAAIRERQEALQRLEAESSRAKEEAAADGGSNPEAEKRAEELEEERNRMRREQANLEEQVRNMKSTASELERSLAAASAEKGELQKQLSSLKSEGTKLQAEQRERKKLERKLQIAEDSLRRLDTALRSSGMKLDVDVYADVRTLKQFFEDRADEVQRDAQRIDIMKQALRAKKRYLIGLGEVDAPSSDSGSDEEDAAAGDDTWDASELPAASAAGGVAAAAAAGAGGEPENLDDRDSDSDAWSD